MDGAVVFAGWRQCAPHLIMLPWAHRSPQSIQHLNRFSHFAQLTSECHRACPGISFPLKIASSLGRSGPTSNKWWQFDLLSLSPVWIVYGIRWVLQNCSLLQKNSSHGAHPIPPMTLKAPFSVVCWRIIVNSQNCCIWLSVEVVGVIDAKQVMPCKSTSVTDICVDSEAGGHVCDDEPPEMSISEQRLQTATNSTLSDASLACENRAKPVRRVH